MISMRLKQVILKSNRCLGWGTALTTILGIGLLSYCFISDALSKAHAQALSRMGVLKQRELLQAFQSMGQSVSWMAETPMARAALHGFQSTFSTYQRDTVLHQDESPPGHRLELVQHYLDAFKSRLQKNNVDEQETKPQTLLDLVDDNTFELQRHYIFGNHYPLGEKKKLEKADNESRYSKVHQKYHAFFRKWAEQSDFYDVFFIDAHTGHILYTVEKEMDFGTSLQTGPYAQSALGKLYQRLLSAPPGTVVYSETENYGPSYGLSSGFVGIALPDESRTRIRGILAIQFSMEKIARLLNEDHNWAELGLESQGDILIVDAKGFLKTRSRAIETQPEPYLRHLESSGYKSVIDKIRNRKNDPDRVQWPEQALQQASLQPHTVFTADDLWGQPSFQFWASAKLNEYCPNWWMVLSTPTKDLLAPRHQLLLCYIALLSLISPLLVLAIHRLSHSLAHHLVTPIEQLTRALREMSQRRDLSKRFHIDTREEELALLVSALNNALDETEQALKETLYSLNQAQFEIHRLTLVNEELALPPPPGVTAPKTRAPLEDERPTMEHLAAESRLGWEAPLTEAVLERNRLLEQANAESTAEALNELAQQLRQLSHQFHELERQKVDIDDTRDSW